jgi:SpoVK/Ycf46/Vps4 family AAA+-type ATPase
MRKGADILSKWVGEAERQLRLLFEQAKRMEPSIIFFDEIDGMILLINLYLSSLISRSGADSL